MSDHTEEAVQMTYSDRVLAEASDTSHMMRKTIEEI